MDKASILLAVALAMALGLGMVVPLAAVLVRSELRVFISRRRFYLSAKPKEDKSNEE